MVITRVVNQEGIRWENLHYVSDELAALVRRIGHGAKLSVRVNLADLAGWFGTYTRVDTSTNCQTQVVTPESGTLTLCSQSALLSPTSFGLHCTAQSVSTTHVSYSCSGKVF